MLLRPGLRAAQSLRPSQGVVRLTTKRNASVKNSGNTVDKLEGVYDNAFNRERLAVKKHAAQTADLWRKLSIYVVIPALIIVSANTWVQWNDHWEHQSHEPAVQDRKQYSYMNIRTKAYPWGDGTKTLFWNDKYNALKKDE